MYYFSVEVHDAVFQVEFPFVTSSGNFIILAYNNIFCIEQITRIPLRYVITTTQGIILSPFTFSIFFVSINVVIRVFGMYLIYTFSLSFSSSFRFQSSKFTSSSTCNQNCNSNDDLNDQLNAISLVIVLPYLKRAECTSCFK